MPPTEAPDAAPRTIPVAIRGALLRLPPLSHAAIKLHSIDLESANLTTIATLISTDAPLSVLVLRLINSPLFGVRCRVTGVLQAVALLGIDRLRVLATTAAFRMMMTPTLEMPALKRCWRHSVACALATQEIAVSTGADGDVAYTAGLLHDIGRFAMLSCWPKQYAHLLDTSHPADLAEQELNTLGILHTEAGAFLLEHWGLPAELVEVARNHHSTAPELQPRLVELVSCGCYVADALGFPVTAIDGHESTLQERHSNLLTDEDAFRFRIADGINQIECIGSPAGSYC
jgi:putative nucleotidyltransferase with HDIG domain